MPRGWKPQDGLNLFPNKRQQSVADVMDSFQSANQEGNRASMMMTDPLSAVVDSMAARCGAVELQVVPVPAEPAAPLEGCGEILGPMPLPEWLLAVRTEEKNIEVGSNGQEALTKRFIAAQLQSKLLLVAATAYQGEDAQNVLITRDFEVDPENPKVTLAQALPDCKLLYFGRVVEPTGAAAKNSIPILAAESEPYQWIIDGKAYMDTSRTDCCIAFLIPPLPLPKKDADAEAAPQVVETHIIAYEERHKQQ